MRCDDCQLVIEEYFDGELSEQTALRVGRHLEGCSSCSAAMQDLTTEQAFYIAGGSEIQVRSDLWSGVRARLSLEEQLATPVERLKTWLSSALVLPRINGWTAVGLVLLAIGLTTLLMRYAELYPENRPLASVNESSPKAAPLQPSAIDAQKKRPTPGENQNARGSVAVPAITTGQRNKPASRRIETTGSTKTAEQLVREAELKYLAAIAMLSRTVDRKRANIDVATLARLEQALGSIDRTIADTRKAVRRHPDDPEVVQYMLTAYAKKVEVLREMVDY